MVVELFAVYCIGVVGDVQVIEAKGKSYFIKGHTVPCVWKSNIKKEILRNNVEQETLMFQNSFAMLTSDESNEHNNYVSAMIPPTGEVDHLCPYGQHGWEWDIDNMENYLIVNREVMPLKKWGFCSDSCQYKSLESGVPTKCSIMKWR